MTRANRARGAMLTRFLLILCLILGPLVYVELEQQDASSPEVIAATETPAARPIIESQDPGFTMPPLENYAEVLARPPFSESRRPAPPGAIAKSIDQPLAITVLGTILAPGSVRALVEHGEPAQVTRVVEGQDIDGWTVKSIRQEKVVLARSGATMELKVKGGTPATPSEASTPSIPMPLPNVGTQRLTKAGALPPPLPQPNNPAIRRSLQPGPALVAAQSDAEPPPVSNSNVPSVSLGGPRGGAARRGR